ncbi:MAG: amino acid adenylation domain-containing protein, partial [bacterium]
MLYLSDEATRALETMSRTFHLTMNTIVQAAWALMLSRYSGEQDVAFGAIVSGRPADLQDVDAMVGLFINTLPVRIQASSQDRALEWLKKLQTRQAEMRDFEFSPLIKVQGWSDVPAGISLFDTIFMFENYRKDMPLEEMGGDLKISNVRWFERVSYPLVALAIPGEKFMLRIIYHRSRFERETIVRMLGHWRRLLEGMVANPQARLSDLPMVTEKERQQLLVDWNATTTDYPREHCIQELFEMQAAQTPDTVAVAFEGRVLTYDVLNRRANQVAHFLRAQGVGPETPVAICMERSLEMVVGLLGILKAGGAYLPLDPDYPEERLTFMLEDTRAALLLAHQKLIEKLPEHNARVICLDSEWQHFADENEANPAATTVPENLAYIMYTSGSTGRPKGTTVPHRAVVRLVRNTNFASLSADEVLLQFAPVSFDAATLELWGSLLNGGKLAVFPAHTPSLEELREVLQLEQVTTLWLTAGLFHQMVEKHLDGLRGVRQLLAGGDVLSVAHIKKVMRELPHCQLINGYGPTENTTFTCCHPFTGESELGHTAPIGRPVANTQVFILDSTMQPVPIGVAGDLYTGGDGLARGYLNRPELTAEKFIPSAELGVGSREWRMRNAECGVDNEYSELRIPNSELGTPKSEFRIYKTGDRAKYRADGTIDFLGRTDFQVKIRGFRIELGEVEAMLAQHPAVRNAVVMAREDEPGAKKLVAYVIADDAQKVSTGELRSRLQESLPDYMVPSAFVMLETFPLDANGKVDRAKLPAPEGVRQVETEFVAPKSEIEQTVAKIWREVLKIDKVGLHDNFFDLGGHSLALIQAHSKLKAALSKDIPMVDLFKYPKVSALAKYLSDESPQQNGTQQAQTRAEKRRAAMQRRIVS